MWIFIARCCAAFGGIGWGFICRNFSHIERYDAAPIAWNYTAMDRRMDRVRTGRDRVTDYLEKYGERLNTGAVRDSDSLGCVVDCMEWISYGELLADQLVDLKYDSIVLPSEHPLIDIILDQFVRRGEPDKTYQRSAGLTEFTFKEDQTKERTGELFSG